MPRVTLDELNTMPPDAAAHALAGIFEHARWIAEVALAERPFSTVSALHEAMLAVLANASSAQQLDFIRGHPELGSKVARAGLTDASKAEQGGLGLDRLSDEEFSRFSRLNAEYRAKFDFPFIICVRRHTRDSILRQFERRLQNDAASERKTAIDEIARITRLRLVAAIEGPGKPRTDGKLTTHILDTSSGRPASSIRLSLHEVGQSARGLLCETMTNATGRTDQPLIAGEPLRIGTYELQADTGSYFGGKSFYDTIPVRFSIAEPEGDYHIPLLISPFGYSAYRGS
jgi:2-oxo-4-hydroxy-4-carboxy-5-ureidoimidazoline decarboxylase